jgi:Tol biopolymer transport system component
LENPALSPDENEAAAVRRDPATGINQLWQVDLRRDLLSRMASGPENINQPLWAPAGDDVVFSSGGNLYRRAAHGTGLGTLLLQKSAEPMWAHAWSRDGRFLVYTTVNETSWDLWLLPLVENGKPTPLVRTPFNEGQANISPDGRWLAYSSDETGSFEIYVQTFPTSAGQPHRISTGGGMEPQWRADGRELFYLSTDGKLMSVDVRIGAAFEAGDPRPLFPARVAGIARNHYVVARDGSRFLINTMPEPTTATPITVVMNWTNLLPN